MDALVVSCVEDATEFAGLRVEWDALQASNEASSVFMSWAWHHTWWTVFGSADHTLCILCVRDRHKLVAVLPLYMRQKSWPRPAHVMFLGTGEGETHEVATEYLDILVSPNHLTIATEAALNFLHRHCSDKRFDFQHLLEDSVLVTALRKRRSEWRLQERALGFRYRIDFEKETADIPMAQKRLKRVTRSLKAVERDGGFEQKSIENLDGVGTALEDVSALSDQRQKQKGRAKSAFASARFNEFHHRLLPLLFQSKAADIQHFYRERELLATLYCFYDEQSCHYYQSGFVQAVANRYMPLTVAHLMEIERNRASGRRYYDFMRGDLDSYKNDFNCEKTPMLNVMRFPNIIDQYLHETFTIVRRRLVSQLKSVGVSRRR